MNYTNTANKIEQHGFNRIIHMMSYSNRNYISAKERLAVFLGIDVFEVEIPELDAPLYIDTSIVTKYVKQNNPLSKEQEIQRLEAERNLFSTKLNNYFNGNISLNYGINQYAETLMKS